MTLRGPCPLGLTHQLEGFDCGKPSLNDGLLRHARQAQGSGSAKTFVVADGDRVVGYFSLTVEQIDTLDAPERTRKGMTRDWALGGMAKGVSPLLCDPLFWIVVTWSVIARK